MSRSQRIQVQADLLEHLVWYSEKARHGRGLVNAFGGRPLLEMVPGGGFWRPFWELAVDWVNKPPDTPHYRVRVVNSGTSAECLRGAVGRVGSSTMQHIT